MDYAGAASRCSSLYSHLTGLGKKREANVEGKVTDLQIEVYPLTRAFGQCLNKIDQPCGWPICVYAMPEMLWDHEHVASAYSLESVQPKKLIHQQACKNFLTAMETLLHAVMERNK